MARLALVVSVIAIMSALGVACGSPPAPLAGAEVTEAAPWSFTYAGRLEFEADAIAAVYASLQSEANNDEAKLYLAEYSMVARNRVAKLSDDGRAWYVIFTMDGKPHADQGEKEYWDSAAWMVFQEGKVLPSNRHGGHAARIVLDLRETSGQ